VAARLPLCGVDVLVVVVERRVLNNPDAARHHIETFQRYFRRTIVLMAQDPRLVPTYYGPGPIVRRLSTLPFEVIPWRTFVYRDELARRWRLPDPAPPPDLGASSWVEPTVP